MTKIKYLLSASVLLLALTLGLALPKMASATQVSEDKVTICHRTNSATNPYVKITVDVSAVDGQGNNDHSQHTGPLVSSTADAQTLKDNHVKWGDIIPPVEGVTDGLNWPAGETVLENGCLGGTELTEVVPAAVTFTAPTCDAKGSYTIPTTEHVQYKVNGQVVAAGTYSAENGSTVTVTAEATEGFFIGDETTDSWTNTFTAPTNCGHVLSAVTQVQAPTGGVGAGEGGASSATSLAALLGVFGSLGSIGYGLRRFGKL
jgi:hypothetical protein